MSVVTCRFTPAQKVTPPRRYRYAQRLFSPGTHVKVRRRLVGLPYWHHGICVHSGEVIEFGGGHLWGRSTWGHRQKQRRHIWSIRRPGGIRGGEKRLLERGRLRAVRLTGSAQIPHEACPEDAGRGQRNQRRA